MSEISKYVRPERPAYRILDVAGFFGPDDTLYEYLSEIEYDGVPALEMEPLNESARIRYIELLERQDTEARKVAEKLGRPFIGRPRSSDGGYEIATAIQKMDMNLMGNQNKNVDTIAPLNRDEAPTMGVKKKGGRPRKLAAA